MQRSTKHKLSCQKIVTYLDFSFHGLGHQKVFRHVGQGFPNVVAVKHGEVAFLIFLFQVFKAFNFLVKFNQFAQIRWTGLVTGTFFAKLNALAEVAEGEALFFEDLTLLLLEQVFGIFLTFKRFLQLW